MLEYNRIDVSEGINVNKTDGSHKCIICHYWYFLEINFKFQPVCSDCHNLLQKAISFNDDAIVCIKGNDYRIPFVYMIKDEAVYLLRNADFTEKSGT